MSRTSDRIVSRRFRFATYFILQVLSASLRLASTSASSSEPLSCGGACNSFSHPPLTSSSAGTAIAPYPPSFLKIHHRSSRSCGHLTCFAGGNSDAAAAARKSNSRRNSGRLVSPCIGGPVAQRGRARLRSETFDGSSTGGTSENDVSTKNDRQRDPRPHSRRSSQSPSATPLALPRHVALICDGNSRWAERQRPPLPAAFGYMAGADRVRSLLMMLASLAREENPTVGRVEVCTLYVFSTENWSRSAPETLAIMALIERAVGNFRVEALAEGNVLVRVLGDLDDERVPEGTRNALRKLEAETASAVKATQDQNGAGRSMDGILTVCLAINYGGRSDILSAVRSLAESIANNDESGARTADDITEDDISSRLCTSGLPDPDLVVRTGGDQRLSNFLLWNAAYAELYFSDTLWPDFDDDAFDEAMVWYGTRKRRFGGRS